MPVSSHPFCCHLPCTDRHTLVTEVFPNEAEAGQSPEAKSAHPPVDQVEDWQHHPVDILPLSLDGA